MSQMVPPEPPRAEWSRIVAAAAQTTNACLTGRLDEFLGRGPARFLPVLQEVAGRCRAEKCFGEGEDGAPRPKQQFLDKTAAALECQQGAEKIARESAMLFQGGSWSILWSLYKREGDRRPGDCAEDLGGSGADNFQRMMYLQARLLEGRPLCKCVLLWSRRGRNGRGICGGVFQAVWGEHRDPVRAAVFTADERSEREHNAADAFRRGVRVAFGNEVHSSALSNAVFKNRNSTDPGAVRACNSGDTEKMKPMCTCISACNVIPSWGQVPKGSERDRLLPMCMPSKFRDTFDAPTPPRSCLTDRGLEVIGVFERGALAARTGGDRGDGRGALLEAWMAEWGRVGGDVAREGEVGVESFALVQDIHARLYSSRPRAQVEQTRCELPLAAPETERWATLLGHVRASGRLGANLFQIGAAKSREQRMQACVAVPSFDASLCDQLFADAAAFGDPAGQACNVSLDACVPAEEGLSARVDLLGQAGKACAMKGGFLRPTSVPECPDIRALCREYYQLNMIGRACESGPGLQSCAAGTRVVAFNGLAVGEFDVIAAFYQIFLGALRPRAPDGAVERDFGVVKMRAAAEIFSRLTFEGGIQPDASWESDRPDDILPCRMELRGAFRRGQEILAAQCDELKKARFWNSTSPLACPTARGFGVRRCPAESPAAAARAVSGAGTSRNREVASMEKVLLKAHPGPSALALCLQTMEDNILESMADAAKGLNACVLSLVFDGMYVAMPSTSDIEGVFDTVADEVWKTRGVRIVLETVGGETIKAFSAKRNRPSDEGEAEAAQKRMKVCHVAQEMEKLLDIDSDAAASGAPEVGGLPCTQEEQRGREPCGGLIGAAAASGATEGGGQLVAREEQRDIEPDTQGPSMEALCSLLRFLHRRPARPAALAPPGFLPRPPRRRRRRAAAWKGHGGALAWRSAAGPTMEDGDAAAGVPRASRPAAQEPAAAALEVTAVAQEQSLERLHILPFVGACTSLGGRSRIECIAPELRRKRGAGEVVRRGDVVRHEGCEFVVIKCEPDQGLLHPGTDYFVDGDPVVSFSKIQFTAWGSDEEMTSERLFSEFIVEYLKGDYAPYGTPGSGCTAADCHQTFQIGDTCFQVDATEPPGLGVVSSQTEIFANWDRTPELEKVHIVPFQDTLPRAYDFDVFQDYLRPYLRRHGWKKFSTGDLFTWQGVQFKVVACHPSDSTARIGKGTTIFPGGGPAPVDAEPAAPRAPEPGLAAAPGPADDAPPDRDDAGDGGDDAPSPGPLRRDLEQRRETDVAAQRAHVSDLLHDLPRGLPGGGRVPALAMPHPEEWLRRCTDCPICKDNVDRAIRHYSRCAVLCGFRYAAHALLWQIGSCTDVGFIGSLCLQGPLVVHLVYVVCHRSQSLAELAKSQAEMDKIRADEKGMDAPGTTVPRPSPVRYCGWCAGPLGRGVSLALAEGGSLLEVCELCYIIGLIRQAAWRARLSVEERAALLDSARLLGALLSALAGLGLDGAEGAAAFPPVAPGLAAAEAVGGAAAAAPAGGGAGAPVAPGLAALPGLPGFGGGGAAGAPPAGGAVPDGGGAPPGGVGAALVGALAGGGGGGHPGGPPPGAVPGAPAIPGVPIAVAGGPIAPAGGAQLGPLVDGPRRQAVTLIGADWRRGVNLELPTFDAAGGISGTALFEVEEIGTTGPSGQYLSAQFRGASLAAEAMRLDGLFPPRGSGPAGLLHLRGQGPALCGDPAVPGRGVLHVEWLRLRSNRWFVEPWVRPSAFGGRGGGGALAGGAPAGGAAPDRLAAAAAARAQAAAATCGRAGGGRGRRRPRSSSASRSDDDGESRFREAPSRGGSVRLLAEKRPGALYDEAMKNIGRVMGLREGADGSEVRAKVVGYLQAVVFGHHPPGQMRINAQRELQTLATALDLLESGCLAELSDVLMQRFKALELSLSDASWQVASELEIVPGARPSLASMGEQGLARRAALLRRKLMGAKSRGGLGGKGQGERSALRQRGQVAVSGGAEDASRRQPAPEGGGRCRGVSLAGDEPGAPRLQAGPARGSGGSGPAARSAARPGPPERPPPWRQEAPGPGPRRPSCDAEVRQRADGASADDARASATEFAEVARSRRPPWTSPSRSPPPRLAPDRGGAAASRRPASSSCPPACGADADCYGDPLAEWREWAGAASDLLREPFDVGPVLLNIVRQFPGSFGRFTRYSLEVKPREHPADMGGRLQRDLSPLPYPSINRSQIVRQGEDPLSDKEWEGLHCRLVVTVLALNWESGFRSLKLARPCRGRANAAQQAALVALGRRLLATRAESALPPDLDWNVRLKDRKIGYGGDEISAPHRLTLEQVLDGLPPPGVAASIEAADLATGFVREALLDPTLVLLPAALRRPAPTSARVWASLEEWHRIVRALHERGMVSAIPSSEIACRDGAPFLNGALGVPKPRDEPVVCSDGERRPVLRPITNLIPSNARQECIVGDTPEMPTMSQLNGLVLTESEDLLWSGADRKAFFYVFRAPPAWWPCMVIGPPVPSELLGLKDGGTTHICLRVIGMGWISAVGVTTHLHRNMLRRSASVPRGLPPSQEITRRRRLPFSVEKPRPPAWMVYIDNLEVAEVVSKSEAATLRGTVPELISEARACYAAAGSPGSPSKDIHRVPRATTLGELIDGVEGVRRPPAGYLIEMASLALWTLSKKRASVRLVRILLGRWVRVHCFRRPLAASFAYAWKWLGNPRTGGRFSVSVVEDLLMCLALSGLCVADLPLEVDPLVTASDASEAAGAVVYGYALSDRGRALAERRQRPANAACEEETALVTVFDGIGGGRRAFEILGLVPAVHLSFEVDPTAVRVARRSYPSTQHLGDVTEADPVALAALMRARGRVSRALVVGGFPCQVFAGLHVARQGLDDPRAGLVDHMVRIVDGLRTAMPEASIDFLGENVASMPECDVLRLNQLFGRIPLDIEAGDVGWVRRPRLYWASWDLLPSFEAEPVVVRAKTQDVRRACKVALKAERPPLEEWLPPGAVCPGPAAGEPLPTFVRWAPRSQPRPRPAGIGECSAAELARWEAAGFASPPYQFRDKWCIHQADGRVEPPDATIREKLMGFPEGHTVPCMTSSQAKAEPAKYEVVAWIISHWAVGAGLLVSVPSLGELHESARAWAGGRKLWAGDVTSLRCGRSEIDEGLHAKLDQPGGPIFVGRGSRRWGLAASRWGNPFTISPERSREDAAALFAGWIRTQPTLLQSLETLRGALLVCHCGPDQACHADILLAELAKRDVVEWRELDASRRIVMGLVMACHNNGADIRTDGASEALGKIFPRQEIDSGIWRWRKARQLVWDAAEHINVLECQGALMMIRWRARSVRRHQCVFLHLLDSMVNIGALSKHRSSSPQLNKVVRTFSAWELAMGARAVFGFTSSARNPADAPSRLRDGAGLGKLRDARIKASTLARYRGAAQRYVDYLAANNLPLPLAWDDIDICLQDYLEHLWAEGATKGEANDTLSGVQHLLRTRRRYPGAWQLLTVWGRLEIPQRAPPMPAQVAFAAVLLVAFHLCLRTGEALGLSGGVIFLKPCGRGVVSLPWTKTSCQKGAREQVTLDDPLVGAVVHMQLQRDSRLWPGTTRAFHDLFRTGLQQIGCRHLALSPCSLRRGGATHEFLLSGDLSKVMLRGRWSSARTAKICIQDGAAIIAEISRIVPARRSSSSLMHFSLESERFAARDLLQ
ncbi:unnamed protein product [Prorocentrum cordatum]|uniref:DUF4326 domain-containing protein n=1 Tax=Prorocentrum cordatum TaxID=2364126 RepID=A0ABN9T1S7_9DINO|nr:unnamed protein product [Polarella glacialis]